MNALVPLDMTLWRKTMRTQLCTLGEALASLDSTADENLVRAER